MDTVPIKDSAYLRDTLKMRLNMRDKENDINKTNMNSKVSSRAMVDEIYKTRKPSLSAFGSNKLSTFKSKGAQKDTLAALLAAKFTQ